MSHPGSFTVAIKSSLIPSGSTKETQPVTGAYQAIKINKEVYQKRISLCQYSLIGRVFLNKSDAP